MSNRKKHLRLGMLLFAAMFLVGAAFAATNGMLVFGGTVRINNVATTDVVRLEINQLSKVSWNEAIVSLRTSVGDSNGVPNQVLNFDFTVNDPARFISETQALPFGFGFQNTGNVPVRLNSVLISGELPVRIRLIDPINSEGGWMSIDSLPHNLVIQPGQTIEGDIALVAADILSYLTSGEVHEFNFNVGLSYEQAPQPAN